MTNIRYAHTRRFPRKRCHCCKVISCNEEFVGLYILLGKVKFLEENFYWIIFRRNIVCAEIRQSLCVGRTSFLSGNGYVFLCISVAAICFFILVISHFLSDLLVFWWEFPARGELTPNVLIAWILLSAAPRQRQRTQKTEACSVQQTTTKKGRFFCTSHISSKTFAFHIFLCNFEIFFLLLSLFKLRCGKL